MYCPISDATFSSFSVENVHFLGSGGKDGGYLMRFDHVASGEVEVRNCIFEGLKSKGIFVKDTDGFRLSESEFRGNYRNCLTVDVESDNAVIERNKFFDNGRGMTNDPVIDVKGGDFCVRNNYFEDFSYSAIGLGAHYTERSDGGTRGIVEKNEICMSEEFRSGVPRQLIDSGCIYVWTKNNRLIIRDNYIHDISGPHGNRGILCDDGAYNVTICHNRIERIKGSYCIDLRRHKSVEHRYGSTVRNANTGNYIYDNITDGRCRIYLDRR